MVGAGLLGVLRLQGVASVHWGNKSSNRAIHGVIHNYSLLILLYLELQLSLFLLFLLLLLFFNGSLLVFYLYHYSIFFDINLTFILLSLLIVLFFPLNWF